MFLKGGMNNYSVCNKARIWREEVHIQHVLHGQVEFPDLLKTVSCRAKTNGVQTLLVEDKASGQQLIQSLWAEATLGMPNHRHQARG